ncbi:MAG: hypothetical protein IPN89_11985 [Saprospiraceae bacterium]|nr:hypothetical protein [Saprospiraceae bacterium]
MFQSILRLNKFNKHRVYCEFSELTPNNLINQTIKTTLNLIQKHFSRYKILQHEIRKIKSSFFDDDVSEMKFNINSIKQYDITGRIKDMKRL